MKLFILLLSIQTVFAQIPKQDSEVWAFGKSYYPFQRDEVTKALISLECLKSKNCEAYKAVLKKSEVLLSEADRSGGKNPGAVVCKKIYDGEVLVLRDTADNENAFCRFKDKSLASAGDLY